MLCRAQRLRMRTRRRPAWRGPSSLSQEPLTGRASQDARRHRDPDEPQAMTPWPPPAYGTGGTAGDMLLLGVRGEKRGRMPYIKHLEGCGLCVGRRPSTDAGPYPVHHPVLASTVSPVNHQISPAPPMEEHGDTPKSLLLARGAFIDTPTRIQDGRTHCGNNCIRPAALEAAEFPSKCFLSIISLVY